jgi:hypothetical protein
MKFIPRLLADGGVWKPRSRALLVAEQQQLVINEEMPPRLSVQQSDIIFDSIQHVIW